MYIVTSNPKRNSIKAGLSQAISRILQLNRENSLSQRAMEMPNRVRALWGEVDRTVTLSDALSIEVLIDCKFYVQS